MPDQADDLRQIARAHRSAAVLPPPPAGGLLRTAPPAARVAGARLLAVVSGKGGVGKTNLAVSLSIALAQLRRRVILVDLDLGLANVDVILDLHARWNLSHVLSGRKDLLDAVVPAAGGIRVLPGASGLENLANLRDGEREALIRSLEGLHRAADVLVFDTGAGISRNTIAFAACADDVLVVTTPEPTAMIDAYAAVKLVHQASDNGDLRLIVNKARDRAEAEKVARGIVTVAHRFLNAYVEPLGFVPADPAVPASVRRKSPFFLAAPRSPAAASVAAIARALTQGREGPAEGRPSFVRRLLGGLMRRG